MKKNILIIVLCLSLVLITSGCNNNQPKNGKDTYNAIYNYFNSSEKDENVTAIYYDTEKQIVIVKLADNSKENQQNFLKTVNVNKKYIEFKQDKSSNDFDIELSINEDKKEESISFNKYLTKENRTVYLENNVNELYVFDNQNRMTFNYYATNTNQSLERSLTFVTDLLDKWDSLKDGGTTVYKDKDKNMTVIVCNTLEGNKDVYIGDYNLSHNDAKCR